MTTWWAKRGSARRAAPEGDVIDLVDDEPVAPPYEPDPVRVAQLAEFRRACAERDEAIRDLQRLRERHWSGERLIEEGRATFEWWEHPEADPYAVLGLLPGAPIESAAAARRRVAKKCHPDRVSLEGAARDDALRRMMAANAAYDRLRRALHAV